MGWRGSRMCERDDFSDQGAGKAPVKASRARGPSCPIRLNNAIGYITPKDMFAGRQPEIHAERDRKLEAETQPSKNRRQRAA